MALMNCPECGKEVSDKAVACIHCGYPIKEDLVKPQQEKLVNVLKNYNKTRMTEDKQEPVKKEEEFNGIYRYFPSGAKGKVYCPRCRGANCSHYQEQKIISGKTKTKFTANLNPLKPFTLVNKKEKVIRPDQIVTEVKFLCNDCGLIFD